MVVDYKEMQPQGKSLTLEDNIHRDREDPVHVLKARLIHHHRHQTCFHLHPNPSRKCVKLLDATMEPFASWARTVFQDALVNLTALMLLVTRLALPI